MSNTLGLDDDLDSVVVLEDLERSFGVKLTDAQAQTCRTVGDIYALLEPHFSRGAGQCGTAMAFYRLRTALTGLGADHRIRPGAALAHLTELPAKPLLRELEDHTGLRMPGCASSWLGDIGMFMVLGGLAWIVVAAFWPASWPMVLLIAGGAVLCWRDQGLLRSDCRTVGALATKVAALNVATLAAAGADASPEALWMAYTELLSNHSMLPKAEMTCETVLLETVFRDNMVRG